MPSESITTNGIGDVYLIQPYIIKIVSAMQQVGEFLRVLRFPPGTSISSTNKTDCVALSTIAALDVT